ncbi:7745_t:CDS:1 [Acaulospora colombiana]|uniref:7745_t:CDS:1 n=1 Tax=Acaulospora colombiana TaxID=27376 RepID=A0ACA9M5S3_9GLOM|nr:7745_t:CDS:1 [Acaulospora colombiana]
MCNHSKQARHLYREIKRAEKHRLRQEKNRLKAEKRAIRQELRNLRRNSDPAVFLFHPNPIYTGQTFNYYSQMPGIQQTAQLRQMNPVQVEEMVSSLRTMFPDCDPQYIRNCISQETSDHIQKVTDKLLESPYPKIIVNSSAPSAPQLTVDDFESELPSYEEATIRPELAESVKNERRASWGGSPNQGNHDHTSDSYIHSLSSTSTSSDNTIATVSTSSTSVSSTSTSHDSSTAKPAKRLSGMTVQQVCGSYSSTLTRPVPTHLAQSPPPSFTQSFAIIPKDGTTIKKGFPIHSYPTPTLESHDISRHDWENFIKGLNTLVGVSNSSLGSLSANFRLMVIGNNDRQTEEYAGMVNEYLKRWNEEFFRPRKIEMELVSRKAVKSGGVSIFKNKSECVQYLLVKSA